MRRYYLYLLMFIIVMGNTLNCYANDQEILKLVKAQKGQVAFYYENLITGEKISYNTDKVFSAASTIKLPLILYVYQLAADGKINLDEYMTYTSGYYYEGTGVIRYQKIGTRYTLRDLAQKSLKHSDNIAYSMLRNRVGRSSFEKYLKGLGGSVVATRGISSMNCRDFSIYLKAFYNFVEKNPKLGKELRAYATNTEFEEHIAGGIKDVMVAHKIGWLPRLNLYHDGGIVYDEQPYILIIFTQDISYQTQKQFFQKTASKVHKYHLEKRRVALKHFIISQGGTMQWNSESQMITAYYNNNVLEMSNGKIRLNEVDTNHLYYINHGNTYVSEELIKLIKTSGPIREPIKTPIEIEKPIEAPTEIEAPIHELEKIDKSIEESIQIEDTAEEL